MSNYLEVDSKILEKNLLLQTDSTTADNFEKFLRSPENYTNENAPWKLATPVSGFCVKTTDSGNNKVFINVCKLDDIPEPKDITESELLELWQSEEVSDYRIPISIQEPHEEFDKSGKPTIAYDVAINTKFFKKIQENMVFQSFVMQVILEGLENKYDLSLKKEGYVILQNRKCLGELRPHRIRMQKTPYTAPKQLIQELSSAEVSSGSGDGRIRKKGEERKSLQYRFFENVVSKFLIGEFYLPNIVNANDLNLQIGEDRIVMESRRGYCFLDFFFPVKINENGAIARFNVCNRILTVKMPIVTDTS